MRAFLIRYSWILLLNVSIQHAQNFVNLLKMQFYICIQTLIFRLHVLSIPDYFLLLIIPFLRLIKKYCIFAMINIFLIWWMLLSGLPCGSMVIFCKIEPMSSSLTITFGEGTDTKLTFVTCFVGNPPTIKWKWS